MKLLILSDSHIRGINPRFRIGNYYKDIMAKIDEILSIAKKLKVKYIIHSGDVFDSEIVSNTIVDDLVDKIEQNKIIWYVVRGNHDEIANSPKLSKASSLDHIFRRSKYVKHLDILETDDTIIKGYDYYTEIEETIKKDGLFIEKSDKYKIAVVHALITEKPFIQHISHLSVKEIKTNYDLIIVAHNHKPFEKEIKNTKIIDIGCLGRRKSDEKEINPSVLFIDTNTKKIQLIKLEKVKKVEECFDLKAIKEKKFNQKDLDNFIKDIKNTEWQKLNLQGMIIEVCNQNGIDEEIKQSLLKKIDYYKEND